MDTSDAKLDGSSTIIDGIFDLPSDTPDVPITPLMPMQAAIRRRSIAMASVSIPQRTNAAWQLIALGPV
jgi:hypothetical protein